MELTAGLGSVDDYIRYIEAGADECFCGYIPYAWDRKYGGDGAGVSKARAADV